MWRWRHYLIVLDDFLSNIKAEIQLQLILKTINFHVNFDLNTSRSPVFWSMYNVHCTWSQNHFYQFKPFLVHLAMAQVTGSSLVIMASWVEVWWTIHHGNSRGALISAHQPSFETDHAVRQLCVATRTTQQKVKPNYNNGNDSSHVVGNWCLNGCWLVLMVVSVTVMFSV